MTIAVIAGGSAGIGQSAAIRIAEQGSGVILTYYSHPEGAEETVAEIEKLGGKAVALPLDMGDSASFPAFREAVVGALAKTWDTDRIDYLVNNAGVGQMAMLEAVTDEIYETLHRVNLKGPLFLTQALLPLLRDGGAIVNTTSSSTQPLGMSLGYSVYGAMKGGLVVLTRYLAKELSARGTRVNSVSPGTTRTRLGGDAFAKHPELIPPIAARTALGRIGEPDDIGTVIAFLLSDNAGWITGQDIEVSGGYNL
ncbi:SDR family NAD(P)-dependent oxidoreductase [Conexibacter sp. CPCC 206217]|uniref:SDR family NAD(P)-dependent oxidoreductase n=1 Tax=Conexibacter sp. CPCC 206217 TaxID=3064574 RepID=UPI00271FAA2F|nr:SDR family oxidoreductase [Conexibacter sp. CPCC 206217]MDO8210494.1 SDR family oxidoreductase [Conexibacter sp. CPCC 206217]